MQSIPMLRAALIAGVLALGPAASSEDTGCTHGAQLQADVTQFSANPPPYVVHIGKPYPARQVLRSQKLRESNWTHPCGGDSSWPWKLRIDIVVDKGSYRKEHRVIVEASNKYPKVLPEVKLGSNIVHTQFQALESMHTHQLQPQVLRDVPVDGNRLQSLIDRVHAILLKPPSDKYQKQAWLEQATKFREDTEVVRKYRKKRTHEDLFTVTGFSMETYVVEPLRQALGNMSASKEELLVRWLSSGLVKEVIPDMVYTFPVFTKAFCEIILDELRGFTETGLPARRPNSMNNYGVILNEIGMEPLMFAIQDKIIQPMAAVLFPKEGSELDGHHAFTVRYKGGEDTHLDVHTDDSDVTFNANIFSDYKGCPLVFCGLVDSADHRKFQLEYWHQLGHAVIHSGRHRHGAEDITKGERVNLIIWSYSQNFRRSASYRKAAKREEGPPDMRCLSYTHDRDYGTFKDYPVGKRERFFGKGWCPKRGTEYQGFVDEASAAKGRKGKKVPAARSGDL